MKILLTGSSGRIGRAIFGALAGAHEVIGLDRTVFSTTHIVEDCGNSGAIKPALEGVDAVIHTAGPHAPHVDLVPDREFERINIEATHDLYQSAREAGVRRFVYTSTTALYGDAIAPGACTWIDEDTPPQPRTIYHRTKLAAEVMLEEMACEALPVRVLRMSRCFPEAADLMALYRLHRAIDARDVGTGHALALTHDGPVDQVPFDRFILSGATPFLPEDVEALANDPRSVLALRAPEILAAMDARGWPVPPKIDRVYSSAKAKAQLGWAPRWDWREVMAQVDRDDLEVLPVNAATIKRSE
ncbi:MAG: NAD(P)-dependent oxidoreductase [Pseudomonadota bacterium]